MSKETICYTCTHRHNYYKRPLNKNQAWCTKYGKLIKGKWGCIDYVAL